MNFPNYLFFPYLHLHCIHLCKTFIELIFEHDFFFLLDCDKVIEAENGEIFSPRFSSSHSINCYYTIKVPKGRRVTVEVLEGQSIVVPCDTTSEQSSDNPEQLIVRFASNHSVAEKIDLIFIFYYSIGCASVSKINT